MELKGHSDQLAAAVESLIDNCRGADSSDQLRASTDADIDKDETLSKRAKSNILASTAAIKSLVAEPTDFLQDFARQVRGCLSPFVSPSSVQCPFQLT